MNFHIKHNQNKTRCSKQLPQEKQQNVKFKQLKMNRQLKLILKKLMTLKMLKNTQENLKMIHQHHKNHQQVATKNNLIEVQQGDKAISKC